jgi:Mn2+/Fe2+ NRAMP family transporter
MKKLLDAALGLVTGIGGFLEIGSIATSAQAGAEFRYQLIWAVAIGTIGLIVLVEMSGRLAAVSRYTLADAMRDRFGFNYFVIPLLVLLPVGLLTVGAEIGGVSLSLQMATGIGFQWWALPVAFVAWLLLWKGTFNKIENGTALLGLVSVVFAIAAVKLHPQWTHVGAALLPTRPQSDKLHYWFLAVAIIGASISPFLYFFYSSGAVEDKWDRSYLGMNRIVATLGNGFGGALAVAVLIVTALVFAPRGIRVNHYEEAALMLTTVFGHRGFILFVATLGITCFGAVTQFALAGAYLLAEGLGWEWSENEEPKKNARFCLTYTILLLLSSLLMVIGIDPLALTNVTVVLAAASLPISVIPMLVLMNDKTLLREHTNGWLSNAVLVLIALLSVVILLAAIPLQILGSG